MNDRNSIVDSTAIAGRVRLYTLELLADYCPGVKPDFACTTIETLHKDIQKWYNAEVIYSWVYRHSDGRSTLYYIGETGNGVDDRIKKHLRRRDYSWPLVAANPCTEIYFTHCPSNTAWGHSRITIQDCLIEKFNPLYEREKKARRSLLCEAGAGVL